MTSDGERARVGTQGVPTGRRRLGLLFAPLRERFRCRGPGVLCFVLARAPHWERRWEGEEGGTVKRGGLGRSPCVRLAGGQWALCAAELTLARAGREVLQCGKRHPVQRGRMGHKGGCSGACHVHDPTRAKSTSGKHLPSPRGTGKDLH